MMNQEKRHRGASTTKSGRRAVAEAVEGGKKDVAVERGRKDVPVERGRKDVPVKSIRKTLAEAKVVAVEIGGEDVPVKSIREAVAEAIERDREAEAVERGRKAVAEAMAKIEAKVVAVERGRKAVTVQHVQRSANGGWVVMKEGNKHASKHFETQAEAIEWGRVSAREHRGVFYVHGADGRVRSKDNYKTGEHYSVKRG